MPFISNSHNQPQTYSEKRQVLLTMFYEDHPPFGSVADEVEEQFHKIPFKGTCISLDDFDETYGFRFEENPRNFDLNYLVIFCEYC